MYTQHYQPRPLPEALKGLAILTLDLRWSWHHGADALWRAVDPELWRSTANPWLILETFSTRRLEELAHDAGFLERLRDQLDRREAHLRARTWFDTHHRGELEAGVAYFCMEFGLHESLPIYSGGLGVLAGDHLKTACDLGVPVVGVGLLYQQGYFRQVLDAHGEQLEFHPYNDPTMMPVVPLRDASGEWIRIPVELPGRTLILRCWQAQVGRRQLYLLDSNDFANLPGDRGITGELYGGGPELRLQQEIALGIGGWRLLDAMGLEPSVCHLNEGHAGFAVLERARHFMARNHQSFETALCATRPGNLFTTHTPVAAGFDRFETDLFAEYFAGYARGLGVGLDALLALGRVDPRDSRAPFNMAYLAIHGSGAVNGVSRLHGAVSRRIFQPLFPRWPQREVPVGHVTNGVHVPTWDSAEADRLWTESCGQGRWLGSLDSVEGDLRRLSDEALWAFRARQRRALIESVRARPPRLVEGAPHALDPDTLTVGFARRFTAYKRPNLLLHDPDRLQRLLSDRDRPVQLLIAGKAHPRDLEGKAMIRQWSEFLRRPGMGGRVIFVEDYDLGVAGELTQGVDLWINTPRRPWEASGTSGMKVLVNGGLNLSELDGWWAEAYTPECGWAIGDGEEHADSGIWDVRDAEQLYRVLEGEVVPTFYERDAHGLPGGWVARMRESMARLTTRFSTNRMLRSYTEQYYLPAAAAYRERAADGGAQAAECVAWRAQLEEHWEGLHFGSVIIEQHEDHYLFQVQAYLDELAPDAVCVELYAEPEGGEGGPVRRAMTRGEPLTGALNGYLYTAQMPATRPAGDFTPRIVPCHTGAQVPLEATRILWYGG